MRRVFQELVTSEGWVLLAKIANGQQASRLPAILQPYISEGEVFQGEFRKGEYAGFGLFIKLPDITIESATAQIEELTAGIEGEVV